mgnify:CR=1 FL=1
MNKHSSLLLLTVLAGALLTACTSPIQQSGYIDVKDTVVDTAQISSRDLITLSEKMSHSVSTLPAIDMADVPPTIAFLEIKNNTDEILDTYNILSQIRKNLIRNMGTKVSFLDRERVEAIKKERAKKRSGEVTANDIDDLQGVDYFLTGNATSITKTDKRIQEIYYRFSFRLVNAETSGIIWEDDYEFKKYKQSSWIN